MEYPNPLKSIYDGVKLISSKIAVIIKTALLQETGVYQGFCYYLNKER